LFLSVLLVVVNRLADAGGAQPRSSAPLYLGSGSGWAVIVAIVIIVRV
jgi:hypothetical protein